MFTGIITDIGTIRSVERRGDLHVTIDTGYDTASIDLGASIACSGVCLTVVDKGPGWFAVDVSGETDARTAGGQWSQGRRLNLERAMKLGDELGGHIVTGHVDGVGEIVAIEPVGESHQVVIRVGAALAPFVAAKGSIAIDGVSLTVNTVTDHDDGRSSFEVNIIPHSWSVTALNELGAGGSVNIEIDILARYLGRMREALAVRSA